MSRQDQRHCCSGGSGNRTEASVGRWAGCWDNKNKTLVLSGGTEYEVQEFNVCLYTSFAIYFGNEFVALFNQSLVGGKKN